MCVLYCQRTRGQDYSFAAHGTAAVVAGLLKRRDLWRQLRGRVVNINFPAVPTAEMKGWKTTVPGK